MRARPVATFRPALRSVAALCMIVGLAGAPAAAKDPGTEAYMIRALACEGPDAKMEIYLPQSIMLRSDAERDRGLAKAVIGLYTLDLTDAKKGKVLEPVRVSLSADKKTLNIDQYTRKLPVTHVPTAGGTVDFDQRFGTQAKCGPFGWQQD